MTEDVPADDAPVAGDELPTAVRTRVVALAAGVLPDVARLPPSLRRVAAFAPTRRARLGAGAIWAALTADDELRERVGTQVSARTSYDIGSLGDREAADPGEQAAHLWLLRPEGWGETIAVALHRLTDQPAASAEETGQLARLRDKLADAEQSVRELRARHRAQIEEYKAENSTLRRKLGEARSAERAARGISEETVGAQAQARARAEAQVVAQDKEIRRLRAQVGQWESEATVERRVARSERDEASLRARILLDTVIDAATGLRRELALPAVSGAPGDRVEVGLADLGTRSPSSAGSLGAASPALLDQYLAMPHARLIVDGYNVSKTAWPSSSLEAQRIRLLNGLAPLVARMGVETTVVFDAAGASARPVVNAPRGVKVFFSPEGVIADDVIRDLVAAEPAGRVVVVVTSDQEVIADVLRSGARSATSAALIGLLARP